MIDLMTKEYSFIDERIHFLSLTLIIQCLITKTKKPSPQYYIEDRDLVELLRYPIWSN